MLKFRRKRQVLPLLAGLLLVTVAPIAQAHEFWVEPARFTIMPGDVLEADIRVGEDMKGEPMLYLPQRIERFELRLGDRMLPTDSRTGDRPAFKASLDEAGLLVLAYVSTESRLTYSEPEKFDRFLRYEGIEWVRAEHERRGLPAWGFSEAYQRFAKSLVKVGAGTGEDRPLGLALELVLETNPYTDRQRDIVARLLWRGQPLPTAQVNVFRRHDGDISRTPYRTDDEGRIRIPRDGAPGTYLLNAVHMIEPASNDQGIVWKSLWASTTFELIE